MKPALLKDFSEELLACLDEAPDFILIRNPDGTIVTANETLCRRLGIPREKLIGRSIYEFYVRQEQRVISQRYTNALLEKKRNRITLNMRDKNGLSAQVEIHGCLVDHKGKKLIFGIGRELGPVEQDARLSAILRMGFQNSNDIMFYTGPNGMILEVNNAFVEHYGYSRKEVIGKTPGILRSRHSSDEFYRHMWKELLDPQKGFWRGEIINRAKDGREIPLILTISAAHDASGEIVGFISSATDIHKHKELEEQIAQTQALADIGEMAASIAHEIRNPLGSVSMAAKRLSLKDLTPEERESTARIIERESARLNQTLNALLSFARPRPLKRKSSDLNSLLKEAAQLLNANQDLASGIELILALDEGLHPFLFDSDQILQVVWNMILNAIQAMEGKGVLTIRSGRSGNFAYFAIADTGVGITKEQQRQIFKPFHTTKSQGTGLGLPNAKRIVLAHGGRVEIDTRPGQGTLFTVWLPYWER